MTRAPESGRMRFWFLQLRAITAQLICPLLFTRTVAVVVIYALLSSQNLALGIEPTPASGGGQIHLPGAGKIPSPESLLEETLGYFLGKKIDNTLPIKLDARDALPTVPNTQLPGGPFHGHPLALTAQNVSRPLAPGDYELHVIAYCTQFSVHRPGRNAAAIIAPLQGTQAATIGKLLWRGTQAGKSPQELQNVAWAIQNGVPFDRLPRPYQDDITSLVPEGRAGLEQGFAIDRPVRELYNDIVTNPRKYILQYKHERGWKWPDALIPNIRITAPPFDQVIAKLGPLGRAYVGAEQDQQAFIRNLAAQEHGQEQPFVPTTDPPLPPTQGPWTVRVPGRAYMRVIVQGGNMQSDNILQIRVLGSATAENFDHHAHLVLTGYQQSQTPQNSSNAGPTVLALMGAPPANGLDTTDYRTPVRYPNPTGPPLRDPIPRRDPVPPRTPTPEPPGEEPIIPEVIEEGAEGVVVLDVIYVGALIIFALIAAQALIIALPRLERDVQILTGNQTGTQTRNGLNSMRLQLQVSGKGVSSSEVVPAKIVSNSSDPGVTMAQVGDGLNQLYRAGIPVLPRRLTQALGQAIVDASMTAKKISMSGGININNFTCARGEFTDPQTGRSYRVDVENMSGWNLRQ